MGQRFELSAMTLDGRCVCIQPFNTDTVRLVKEQLAQNYGISSNRIELILGGQKLKDAWTVADLNVSDGMVLNVIVRSPMPSGAFLRNADKHCDLMDAIRSRPSE